jgi:hypothetical protein
VFLAHQDEGAVQSAAWVVGRPRRAWAPASMAARPLVRRHGGDAWRAWAGGAGRCSASGRGSQRVDWQTEASLGVRAQRGHNAATASGAPESKFVSACLL